MLSSDEKVCSIQMLKSKGHEYFALCKDKYDRAMELESKTEKGKEKTVSACIRAEMDRKKGLLLLYPIDYRCSETRKLNIEGIEHKTPFGFAIVFPKGNGKTISYQVNPIAMKGESYDFLD